MRTLLILLLLTLPLLAESLPATVASVHDGDTVRLTSGQRVRLWGIDCPELKQAGGVQARDWLAKRCEGKPVVLVTHGEDRYGRILAVVQLRGEDLNAGLLRAGWAWWYRKYTPDAHDYEALERTARTARVGLWREASPLAPWDWRHRPKQSR